MKINTYYINCNTSVTDLCEIGAKYGTDKSPVYSHLTKNYYNRDYRHSYTPFYSILFSFLKNQKINFGEIGIAQNSSIKMWREYFSNAKIYSWDGNIEIVEKAKQDNLKDVVYDYMHTEYEESIQKAFLNCGVKFDVLLDDASHFFWDQIRVIRLSTNYLKTGSLLIIEDIDKNIPNIDYITEILKYGHDKFFDNISFIEFDHENTELGNFNNNKIILMVAK
jgi:hypothetical protein